MLATLEISKAAISSRQAALRKHALKAILGEAISAVMDAKTGKMLEYRHLMQSPEKNGAMYSFGNEIGRLAQGMPGRVGGTDTIKFIALEQISKDRRKYVTYARIVCNKQPQKKEANRTRIAVGGNLINCPFDCGTPTADMITVRLLLKSVISTPGVKWMTLDIRNFYLNTPEYKKKRVYENGVEKKSGGCLQTLQSKKIGNRRWQTVRGNFQRDAWATACRHNSTRVIEG